MQQQTYGRNGHYGYRNNNNENFRNDDGYRNNGQSLRDINMRLRSNPFEHNKTNHQYIPKISQYCEAMQAYAKCIEILKTVDPENCEILREGLKNASQKVNEELNRLSVKYSEKNNGFNNDLEPERSLEVHR